MDEKTKEIIAIEKQIEEALWSLEVHDEIDEAYNIYLEAETKLLALNIATDEPAYPEQQRVLAYCLMRQGNLLRQKQQVEAALKLSERELAAARASKDDIALARSLMSNGMNWVISGEADKGLGLIDEAQGVFESGETYDHQQGLGWYWILQADLANAGIIKKDPVEVLVIVDRALAILTPIENWPGVARAYAARVKAHEKLGDEEEAAEDRKKREFYQNKIALEEDAS